MIGLSLSSVSKQNRNQDISGPGHLATEHMRNFGTRYWTSRYSVLDISVLEISVLNNKNNLIEFKNFLNFFFHVDVVYTNFRVFFF